MPCLPVGAPVERLSRENLADHRGFDQAPLSFVDRSLGRLANESQVLGVNVCQLRRKPECELPVRLGCIDPSMYKWEAVDPAQPPVQLAIQRADAGGPVASAPGAAGPDRAVRWHASGAAAGGA